MSHCCECGQEQLTRSCNLCGNTVCTEHRLPEKHHCPNLDGYTGGAVAHTNVNEEDSGVIQSITERVRSLFGR